MVISRAKPENLKPPLQLQKNMGQRSWGKNYNTIFSHMAFFKTGVAGTQRLF
jgi:hypothetical protein